MGSIGQTFLGSIDQGTTSSRFLIFSAAGDVVASHQLEFRQIYPQPGWHEHDPLEIVSSVEKCIDGAVASFESQGHSIKTIKAIGITNQRETTVVWDKDTGGAALQRDHPEGYGSLASTVLKGFRITGCLGDQSAALVGQKAFTPGLAKNTYGTGCFLLYNIGETPVISKHGLLTTVAFDFNGKVMYALEGSIAVGGSSVKFLVNNFGFIDKSSDISALAETVEDNGGLVFVTAFSGLFAPYWIDDARGTMFGITTFTNRGHVARATLEATCFQTKAILDAMEKDSGHKLTELAVDGGMCNSDLTMQTQSDIISIPVHRPAMRETTALGAAIAAGLAVGVWQGIEDLKTVNTDGCTVFTPAITKEEAASKFSRWEKAVQMCKGWAN
ncbi:hypothetical protein HCAG_01202 [Histoplasma mississippiense (nom. inval.)]|uniref:hypothetical protein n=1 Tax=Ajellomyces capsulatus (strain NAm1 / WU24) TaxID=2059318 RepID=UPI000157B950|nr:hypothetical protein HCAG_01202 [Histoplasma mississippiense (nom. inval.)]EDN03337.1 hypothetical protein HCAG_01202 [Histoplasma mississippiense (nom. inval.)]